MEMKEFNLKLVLGIQKCIKLADIDTHMHFSPFLEISLAWHFQLSKNLMNFASLPKYPMTLAIMKDQYHVLEKVAKVRLS